VSIEDRILAVVTEAVIAAVERTEASKEVMNAEEARAFMGLTLDEWKKRSHLIPARQESPRKRYYLREDLLAYLRSLPIRGRSGPGASDYPSDYGRHLAALEGTDRDKLSA